MSDREEKPRKMPFCKFRKKVNGMFMCYAMGFFEVGDMACECYGCERYCSKSKNIRRKNTCYD